MWIFKLEDRKSEIARDSRIVDYSAAIKSMKKNIDMALVNKVNM